MVSTGRTGLIGRAGFVAVLVLAVLTRPGLVVAEGTAFARSLGLAGLPLYAASIVGWCATRMREDPWLQRRWFFIAAALAVFGVGQFIEEFVYVAIMHISPPGLSPARLLIVAAPVLFGAGFGVAMVGLRRALDVTSGLVAGAGSALLITMFSWAALWKSPEALVLKPLDAAIVLAYPLLLAWFVSAPLVACMVVILQLGGGEVARPWWVLGAGVMALLASSLLLVAQAGTGSPWNAGPGEIGIWIGCVLIAVGASLELDVQGLGSARVPYR